MIKTKDLIDQKWNAIDSATTTMRNVRSDLFDNVALALSRVEGKMQFLNGENFEGEPFLQGHSQKVGLEVQQEVNQARKALDEVFAQLRQGRDELFNG